MSTTVARQGTLASATSARSLIKPLAGGAFLLVLLAASAWRRTRSLDQALWIDEALSIGIASHPVADIPGLLAQDGSPPLYYLLLAGWMELVGDGEAATAGLSLAFGLAIIPVALWSGWTLAGVRAGWLAAVAAAFLPFLTTYAQETRMYTLVGLLSLVATTCLLAIVVHRRSGWWVAGLAASLTVALYTHNWGLLLLAAVVAVAAVAILRAPSGPQRKRMLRDVGIGAVVLFIPWVPTLLDQAAHTAAPWSIVPGPDDIWTVWRGIFGGTAAGLIGFATLVAATALALHARGQVFSRALHVRGQVCSRASGPVLGACVALVALLFAMAFVLSQLEPGWATRYFAVAIGPLVLALGVALDRLGLAGFAVAVVLVVLWAGHVAPGGDQYTERDLAAVAAPLVRPGDVVVSTHPERVPALEYYLPAGLRYATPLGPVADPRVVDWRDAVRRIDAAGTPGPVKPILDRLRPGRRLLLVLPLTGIESRWKAPWTRRVRDRTIAWEHAMNRDPRFAVIDVLNPDPARSHAGVRAVLLEKR
jgi:mannosyltransferase